jgi:hypothetical protein
VVSTPGHWGNPVFGAWKGGRNLALISTFTSFPGKMSGGVAAAAFLTRGTRYSFGHLLVGTVQTRHYQTTFSLPSSSQERGGGVATAKPYVVQQREAWPAWRMFGGQAGLWPSLERAGFQRRPRDAALLKSPGHRLRSGISFIGGTSVSVKTLDELVVKHLCCIFSGVE